MTNCQMDDKPHEEMYNLGDRISILTDMLIYLKERRRSPNSDERISDAMYNNGMDMIRRLAGGKEDER